jgi:YVTN family beta-propeller protein
LSRTDLENTGMTSSDPRLASILAASRREGKRPARPAAVRPRLTIASGIDKDSDIGVLAGAAMGKMSRAFRFFTALAALLLLFTAPLSAEECVLIVTTGNHSLTIFDNTHQRVSARIPVGAEPVNVAVSANGSTAFVANAGDDSVSVVDLDSGTSVAVVPVGAYPIDLAVHPDGRRLYVSERNSDRVSIVDIATRQVTGSIRVGSGPSDLVIRRDGRRAYVANFRSNSVAVLDLENPRVAATISVGEQPFALALSPDDKRLYAVNTISATLSIIDTSSERVISTVPLGGFPIDVAVHPDGRSVYVSRGAPEGDVAVIDTATGMLRGSIPVEAGAELGAIALSGDGAVAYTVEFIFGNLFFIDTMQGRVVKFEAIGGVGSDPQAVKAVRIPGGCPTPPIPRLAADLGAADEEIRVDRPDALPIGGTLMIGAELATYRSVLLDRLREVMRGVHGTTAVAHAVGTPVYLVGLPPDANCDGRTGAADLTDLIRQLPRGVPGACGGDVDRDAAVTPADLAAAIDALYGR